MSDTVAASRTAGAAGKLARAARASSRKMMGLTGQRRSEALLRIADGLAADREAILAANAADMEAAARAGVAAPLVQRLGIDAKLEKVVDGVRQVATAADPVGAAQWRRRLDDGLELTRVARPIGVLGIVFESRPDALVQIASLCLKTANAVVMKGGSEAARTNQQLHASICSALSFEPAFAGAVGLMTTRDDVAELLELDDLVDLIIPRGGNELVRSIKAATRIPVMGHADGICHVYVHADANLQMAVDVLVDSKTETVAVCNAAETLLVHRDIAAELLPRVVAGLRASGTELRGDETVASIVAAVPATDADWDTEYLDYILSAAVVADLDQAVSHINTHGSGHTDTIVTADAAAAAEFMQRVDSASVMWNASTRFADGYRFGMGAEVGISTNRIHARGPVGIDGLLTYQYQLRGTGQLVADYTSGSRSFHFVDLPTDDRPGADTAAPATQRSQP